MKKIAMQVTMFTVVLAGAVASENMGQPLPFPQQPPAQMSRNTNFGQPLPFPQQPPAALGRV